MKCRNIEEQDLEMIKINQYDAMKLSYSKFHKPLKNNWVVMIQQAVTITE